MKVKVSHEAITRLLRQNVVLKSNNDSMAAGNAVHLIDSQMKEYTALTKSTLLGFNAYEIHILVAHALATEPGNCRIHDYFLDECVMQITGNSCIADTDFLKSVSPSGLRGLGNPSSSTKPPASGEGNKQSDHTIPKHGGSKEHDNPTATVEGGNADRGVVLPEVVVAALGGSLKPPTGHNMEFGRLMFGSNMPEAERIYDEDTEVVKVALADMNPKWLGNTVKAFISKDIMQTQLHERSDVELREALKGKKIKPQGVFMLPQDPRKLGFACAQNIGNIEAALATRHLGPRVKLAKRHLKMMEEVSTLYYETLKETLGGKAALVQLADLYLSSLPHAQANAWTGKRVETGFNRAVTTAPMLQDKGKDIPRTMAIKINEWLGKLKARGIISAGDLGCVVHSSGCSLLDFLENASQPHLDRSVKHCTKPGLARRMAGAIGAHDSDDWLHSSDDFGAFDSSLRFAVRDAIENNVCQLLQDDVNDLAGELGKAAIKDRRNRKRKIRAEGLKITTKNCCRESGDKGTSGLNRVSNRTVTGCVLKCLLLIRGVNGVSYEKHLETDDLYETIPKAVHDAVNQEIKKFFAGKSTLADLFAEGDDGLRWWARVLFGNNDREAACALIVKLFADFGFNLEPQSVGGRDCTALDTHKGRYEFVSIVFAYYKIDRGVRVPEARCRLIPKPRKVLDSLCVTFQRPDMTFRAGDIDFPEFAWKVVTDKSLALLVNCVDCPLLFRALLAIHKIARAQAVEDCNACVNFDSFMKNAGYNGLEAVERFGDQVSTYLDKLIAVRTALEADREGEAIANRTFVNEMVGSSAEDSCLRSPLGPLDIGRGEHAREMLEKFVCHLEAASPSTLVGIWGAWRSVL